MRISILCAVLGLAACGCATQRSGYIYSPTAGGRGSINFPNSAENSGPVQATLTSGERCTGRFATVPGQHVSYDDEEVNRIYSEDTQDGMALLQCNPGHLLRCTFTRDTSGDGMGRCLDNKNEWLTVYF
jgi:hypothetical protein